MCLLFVMEENETVLNSTSLSMAIRRYLAVVFKCNFNLLYYSVFLLDDKLLPVLTF